MRRISKIENILKNDLFKNCNRQDLSFQIPNFISFENGNNFVV